MRTINQKMGIDIWGVLESQARIARASVAHCERGADAECAEWWRGYLYAMTQLAGTFTDADDSALAGIAGQAAGSDGAR